MTDNILRSYYNVSSSMFVPFAFAAAGDTFANLLLTGETDGFALDATDVSATPSYVGAPYAGYVSVKDTGTPANNKSNVALDSSNLVQSSVDPKMVHWNSSPYVRWSPHNYLEASEVFTNGVDFWQVSQFTLTNNSTAAPNGATTADTVTANSGAQARYLYNNSVLTIAGAAYTSSIYVKKNTYNFVSVCFLSNADGTSWVKATFDLDNPSAATQEQTGAGGTLLDSDIISVGSGWYRISVTGTIGANNNGAFQFNIEDDGTPTTAAFGENNWTAAGSEAVYVWGAQLNRGVVATPYLVTTGLGRVGIPQSYDAAASEYGILVEPAATNLTTQSVDVSWFTSHVSQTRSQTGPDNSTDAVLYTGDGAGSTTYYSYNVTAQTVSSGSTYTASVYVKAGTQNYIYINTQDDGAGQSGFCTVFDLSLGQVGEHRNGGLGGAWASANIVSVGGGWYRCSHTGVIGAVTGSFSFFGYANAASGNSFGAAGDAITTSSGTVTVFGFQVELGTVATSYIPTPGSTVTRAADSIKALVSSFPGSDTADTFYLDYKPLTNSVYGLSYVKTNAVYVLLDLDNSTVMHFHDDVTFNLNLGALALNTRIQATGAVSGTNGAQGSKDGAAPSNDASITLSTGYVALYFGAFVDPGFELDGFIYRMVQVPYNRQEVNGDLATWRYNF